MMAASAGRAAGDDQKEASRKDGREGLVVEGRKRSHEGPLRSIQSEGGGSERARTDDAETV